MHRHRLLRSLNACLTVKKNRCLESLAVNVRENLDSRLDQREGLLGRNRVYRSCDRRDKRAQFEAFYELRKIILRGEYTFGRSVFVNASKSANRYCA
jgi:hypothetical protein